MEIQLISFHFLGKQKQKKQLFIISAERFFMTPTKRKLLLNGEYIKVWLWFHVSNVAGLYESYKKLCYDTSKRHKIFFFINFVRSRMGKFLCTREKRQNLLSRFFNFQGKEKQWFWLSFNESFVCSLNFIILIQPKGENQRSFLLKVTRLIREWKLSTKTKVLMRRKNGCGNFHGERKIPIKIEAVEVSEF